jgi:hypothetical protein
LIAIAQLSLVPTETVVPNLILLVSRFRTSLHQETATEVAADLLLRWSFPEDFRAFRKYLARLLASHRRQSRPIGSAGKTWLPSGDGASWVWAQDAGAYLGLSTGYIYKLIDRKSLETNSESGYVKVRERDVSLILSAMNMKNARRRIFDWRTLSECPKGNRKICKTNDP